MRLALYNPLVFAISALGALSVLVALAWAVLAPPDPPSLERQIADARTVLEQARGHGAIEKLPYLITIPPADTVATDARKALFLAKFLPLVVAENARIAAQRQRLQSRTLGPAQLKALGLAYRMKPHNISTERLLARIDVLPESLVLAQAAIESAWGTSRFAQQGNAYFGERTFDPDAPGLSPKRASGFKVKSFDSARMSVRSYMRTLNTHRAYKALRQRRAQLREAGQTASGLKLARYLKDYSEIGSDYITLIERTMTDNHLQAFDRMSLSAP